MNIYVVIMGIVVCFILLAYIDQKTNYKRIDMKKASPDNGDEYFFVTYFFWQQKKAALAKEKLKYYAIFQVNGSQYEVTAFQGSFAKASRVFIERELRFLGRPVTSENPNIKKNQKSNGPVYIDYHQDEVQNIENYLSINTSIDQPDKDLLYEFLEKVKHHEWTERRKAKKVYTIFSKHEALASLAVRIVNGLRNYFQ